MSKMMSIAKFTLAFVIIAGGFSFIIGSMSGGGGLSRSYDKVRGINNDPRSILVQAVLVESRGDAIGEFELPIIGSQLTDAQFQELATGADTLRNQDGVHVRTPTMLVQHSESGSLSIRVGDRIFETHLSPSVIETKRGNVLRVALNIQRVEPDSSDSTRGLEFTTAFTTAPGGAVVLDLADLGEPGSRAVLALHTTLIDPTPPSRN